MHRILIVEDEPDVADLVAFNLERAGYETVVRPVYFSGGTANLTITLVPLSQD